MINKIKLNKGAFFTDLHVGAKNNSVQHNDDCENYINWFCDIVKNNPEIDHICFLGDWHEVRNAINIQTLKYSHDIAQKIDSLGLPVFFIVGNHDLYHRNNRTVYSTYSFKEFKNFKIIDTPTVFKNIGDGVLMSPFLFHEEYPNLLKYNKVPVWIGHFEFKGFIVTGYTIKMKSGPEHTNFKKPKHIFSGHFHKRQSQGNVTYIGNTFPTNFSDADDFQRGMMIYDYINDEQTFHDWKDCPKYISCKLSNIVDDKVKLYSNARVRCIVDIPITYEESLEIRQKFIEDNNLREFTLDESEEINDTLTQTEANIDENEIGSVDEMVIEMLGQMESDHIDNDLLTKIYNSL